MDANCRIFESITFMVEMCVIITRHLNNSLIHKYYYKLNIYV